MMSIKNVCLVDDAFRPCLAPNRNGRRILTLFKLNSEIDRNHFTVEFIILHGS